MVICVGLIFVNNGIPFSLLGNEYRIIHFNSIFFEYQNNTSYGETLRVSMQYGHLDGFSE